MERPYLKLYTRDWLDDQELRRTSATARAVLLDLMCMAHEGTPYGHLSDKIGPLKEAYMAFRCVVSAQKFRSAVAELISHGRLKKDPTGTLLIPRMVRDEEIRVKRAEGGIRGGNPALKGYPSGYKNGYPERLTDPLRATRSRALPLTSGSSSGDSSEGDARGNPLYSKFSDFLELWQFPCVVCKHKTHTFRCLQVNLAAQYWNSLVDRGVITTENSHCVMDGLERYRASKDWHTDGGKYVLSMPGFLGFSRDGTPSEPRWNDKPEPLGEFD